MFYTYRSIPFNGSGRLVTENILEAQSHIVNAFKPSKGYIRFSPVAAFGISYFVYYTTDSSPNYPSDFCIGVIIYDKEVDDERVAKWIAEYKESLKKYDKEVFTKY